MKAQDGIHKQLQESVAKMNATTNLKPPAEIAEGAAKMQEWRAQTEANLTHTGEAWNRYYEEVNKGRDIAAQNALSASLEKTSIQLADGQITKKAADMKNASDRAADYAAKIKVLTDALKDLQKAQTLDAFGRNTDPKNAAQQQQVQNSINELQGQKTNTANADAAKIQQDIAQPYLDAYKEITSSFMQMQDAMLTGHKTFAQAMRTTEQQLALWAIHQIELQVIKHGAAEVTKLAQHMGFLTAKKAADTTDATSTAAVQAAARSAGMAMTISTNIAEIESLAAVAAAAAFASTAAIPVVGLEAAPAASATAYSAVSNHNHAGGNTSLTNLKRMVYRAASRMDR